VFASPDRLGGWLGECLGGAVGREARAAVAECVDDVCRTGRKLLGTDSTERSVRVTLGLLLPMVQRLSPARSDEAAAAVELGMLVQALLTQLADLGGRRDDVCRQWMDAVVAKVEGHEVAERRHQGPEREEQGLGEGEGDDHVLISLLRIATTLLHWCPALRASHGPRLIPRVHWFLPSPSPWYVQYKAEVQSMQWVVVGALVLLCCASSLHCCVSSLLPPPHPHFAPRDLALGAWMTQNIPFNECVMAPPHPLHPALALSGRQALLG